MKKSVHRRINITLPESTLAMLETVADKGGRSGIIDNAIKVYVKDLKRKALRQQLKEGALARAERDLAMADEWFDAENELWLK